MERFSALIGFVLILAIAFALSNNKRSIRWRTVGWGLLLQILIAIAVLKGDLISQAMSSVAPPLSRPGAAGVFILALIVVAQVAKRMDVQVRRILWWTFGVFALYILLAFN